MHVNQPKYHQGLAEFHFHEIQGLTLIAFDTILPQIQELIQR